MNDKKTKFIQLIDRAVKIAEQMRSINKSNNLNRLITVLKDIKNQIITDKLEASKGITTLGLARQVSDWIDSLDSPLLEAVGEIEKYYKKEYDV